MRAGELLTTLANTKKWLNVPDGNTDVDAFLSLLIKSASAFVLQYVNRTGFGLQEHSEVYDGYGNSFMILRNDPVRSISAMSFNGTAIGAATGDGFTSPMTNGWRYTRNQRVDLFGYNFPRQKGSIFVKYLAGYVIDDEAVTVPIGPGPYIKTVSELWVSNVGVKLADGTALVLATGAPAPGQYSVAAGVYTFNAAQAGVTVLISYSFVPADIQQAVWEMVGERFKYQDRIGINSKSLGGQETVSYSRDSMSSYVKELLQPYKIVVPI